MEIKIDSHRQHLAQYTIEQAPEGVFWGGARRLFYQGQFQVLRTIGLL